jgi:hypothetical protein
MLLTNSCTVLGSLGTAVFTWGSPDTIYAVMGLCRFILGVGVGGKYPLAATMSSEATGRNDKRSPIEVGRHAPLSPRPYLARSLVPPPCVTSWPRPFSVCMLPSVQVTDPPLTIPGP